MYVYLHVGLGMCVHVFAEAKDARFHPRAGVVGGYELSDISDQKNMYYSCLMFTRDEWTHTLEKRQYLQQMVLRKLDVHKQKNEIRPMYIILHKKQK